MHPPTHTLISSSRSSINSTTTHHHTPHTTPHHTPPHTQDPAALWRPPPWIAGGLTPRSIGETCHTILIKLILDMWLHVPAEHCLALVFTMLAGGLTNRSPHMQCRAFDLLFNLSVHGELLFPRVGGAGVGAVEHHGMGEHWRCICVHGCCFVCMCTASSMHSTIAQSTCTLVIYNQHAHSSHSNVFFPTTPGACPSPHDAPQPQPPAAPTTSRPNTPPNPPAITSAPPSEAEERPATAPAAVDGALPGAPGAAQHAQHAEATQDEQDGRFVQQQRLASFRQWLQLLLYQCLLILAEVCFSFVFVFFRFFFFVCLLILAEVCAANPAHQTPPTPPHSPSQQEQVDEMVWTSALGCCAALLCDSQGALNPHDLTHLHPKAVAAMATAAVTYTWCVFVCE